MNWDEEQKLQKKLQGGWTAVLIGTALSFTLFLIPVTVITSCVGIGRGIGAMTWPGYSGKGLKLIAASVFIPLAAWTALVLFWYLAIKE
jgi:hypothetical protein